MVSIIKLYCPHVSQTNKSDLHLKRVQGPEVLPFTGSKISRAHFSLLSDQERKQDLEGLREFLWAWNLQVAHVISSHTPLAGVQWYNCICLQRMLRNVVKEGHEIGLSLSCKLASDTFLFLSLLVKYQIRQNWDHTLPDYRLYAIGQSTSTF